MGLFDIFKKKTIDWTAKTISELETVINKQEYPSEDDKQFCIMNYIHKIIESPKSVGGFGGSKEYISANSTLLLIKKSVEYWGIHMKSFPNGRKVINNYILHFIKNYIAHDFVKPINPECLKYLIDALSKENSEDEEERKESVLLKVLIQNENSELYTAGLYNKFGSYKMFIAIELQNDDFLAEYPVYERDRQGNWTDERLSVADVADIAPEDVEAFIGDSIRP